ncbi:MAG TPA: iron dependent repressor, metal binding and dimerization domain protein, partial [Candidatus Nitrosotenuis sp.]|nr:iron dependent repressor, metal binding and dimerization domain protein [Candidatus Nitrosotenuis sp.]
MAVLLLALVVWSLWPRRGLLDWWRRLQATSQRVLIEDALKFLERSRAEGHEASLEGVAGVLGISTGRAASLLAEMERRELLDSRSGRLELTPEGRRYALQIQRAHRLWERYLADETGYDESEWHDRADRQEHRVSREEVEALS